MTQRKKRRITDLKEDIDMGFDIKTIFDITCEEENDTGEDNQESDR